MGFFPYSTQNRQIKISPTAFCRANRRVANNSTYTVSNYFMVSALYKIEQFIESTLFTGTSTLYTSTSTSDIGNRHVVIKDWRSSHDATSRATVAISRCCQSSTDIKNPQSEITKTKKSREATCE